MPKEIESLLEEEVRMSKKFIVLALMLSLVSIASAAPALYWDGSTNQEWGTGDNWSTGLVPTSAQDAAIDVTTSGGPNLGTGDTGICKYVDVGYAAGTTGALTVSGGKLTVTDKAYIGYSGTGSLSMTGGTIDVVKYDFMIAASTGSSGSMEMSDGVIHVGRKFIVGGGGTGSGTASFTMSGGSIGVVMAGSTLTPYDFQMASAAGVTCTGNMSGGTITVARDFIASLAGTGVYTMTGGVINVIGGKLKPTGNASSNGTINLDGGTVYANGVYFRQFDPLYLGSATGLINITGGKMVLVDLDGTTKTLVEGYVTGGGIKGYGFADLDHVIVSYDSVAQRTTVTAVPEPATITLLGLAGLVLIRRRRHA